MSFGCEVEKRIRNKGDINATFSINCAKVTVSSVSSLTQ